jgi:hypothetical protein
MTVLSIHMYKVKGFHDGEYWNQDFLDNDTA